MQLDGSDEIFRQKYHGPRELESRPNLSRHDELSAWTFAEAAASTDCEDLRTFLQPFNSEFRFARGSNFFPMRRVTPVLDFLIDVVTRDAFFGRVRVPDQLL